MSLILKLLWFKFLNESQQMGPQMLQFSKNECQNVNFLPFFQCVCYTDFILYFTALHQSLGILSVVSSKKYNKKPVLQTLGDDHQALSKQIHVFKTNCNPISMNSQVCMIKKHDICYCHNLELHENATQGTAIAEKRKTVIWLRKVAIRNNILLDSG